MRYMKVIHFMHGRMVLIDYGYCHTLLFHVSDNTKLDYQLQENIRRHHSPYIAKNSQKVTLLQTINDYEIVIEFLPRDKIIKDYIKALEYW